MGRREKQAYLEAILPRYKAAGRRMKKQILDEFCINCGHNRKYAIGLLNGYYKRVGKAKRGRKPKYCAPLFLDALQTIWKASDYMCSKRLKAVIPEWLPHYERAYKPVDGETKSLLLSASPATLDRILKPMRARLRKGLCGTKPGSLLRTQIPIRTGNWDIGSPGFMEADTVAHCGNSLAGDFVWSLTMTDIHTGWTECRAVWDKGAANVVEQIRDIERNLPFKLKGFDCDNGSEFLNHHLVRYFTNRRVPVRMTRSRPYRKNDNAHVEQKNWTHPRHLLGYDRIDDKSLIPAINDLYANEWALLQNHFYPSAKLISKTKINSKYKKIHDKPTTPYQRLIASAKIPKNIKIKLTALHNTINPFILKKTVERKLKAVFKNITVTSNVRQRI
jgi:hypothetical protein